MYLILLFLCREQSLPPAYQAYVSYSVISVYRAELAHSLISLCILFCYFCVESRAYPQLMYLILLFLCREQSLPPAYQAYVSYSVISVYRAEPTHSLCILFCYFCVESRAYLQPTNLMYLILSFLCREQSLPPAYQAYVSYSVISV